MGVTEFQSTVPVVESTFWTDRAPGGKFATTPGGHVLTEYL